MFKYKKNNNILSKSKIWIIITLTYIFLLLNFQKNDGKYKSNLLIGLCAIGKNENLYAEEFVKYYKKLGYDHIFIYDNNNINDERFQKVLLNYISDDFVTIIDYRGFRGKNNHPQFDAYFDCYQKNYKNYDWLSFFDFDEFLELRNNKSIKEFLSNKEFNKCKNIKINWVVYSDNDLVYYDNRSIQERFTKPLLESKMNYHIKSTVRGHLKKNFWNKIYHPHSSNVSFTACSSTGKILKDYSSPFQIPPNYENAYLKHYSTKSIEEYIHKIKRGRADLYYKLDNKMWNFALNHFFEINKKTKAKINYCFIHLNFHYLYKK